MLSVQWKKVINDLIFYRSRSLMVIAALILGTLGIGSVMTSYSILQQDLPKNFLATNPASATVWTDQHITRQQMGTISQLPFIADVESRKVIRSRILVGDNQWLPLQLFVVYDFEDLKLAKFHLQQGRFPTSKHEIAIERDAIKFKLIDTQPGDHIQIKLPEQPIVTLNVTGVTFDPGQAPSHMDHVIFGYITQALYQSLTGDTVKDEIKVTVTGDIFDTINIQQAVTQLREWFRKQGIHVTRFDIPPPGQHPHQWQLDSLLFLQGGYGLLALILSSVLIINIMNFLLARHNRQNAIMKAIGARTSQVMKLYYMTISALALIALIFSIPLSINAGMAYAQFVAMQLNFNIMTHTIPVWVYITLILVGLLLPLLIASYPVIQGSRKTIREALSSYGINHNKTFFWLTLFQKLLGLFKRSVQIAIGNTFRRTGRLVLTLSTLALGLSLFQIGMNLRASLGNSLDIAGTAQRFDLAVTLDGSYPMEQIKPVIQSLDNIGAVEYWNGVRTTLLKGDGTESYRYQFTAVEHDTSFIHYPIIKGHWLQSNVNNEIVINNAMFAAEPELTIGKTVNLNLNNQAVPFEVIGVFKDFGWPARAFITNSAYVQATSQQGVNSIRIVAKQNDPQSLHGLQQQLEANLQSHGIEIISTLLKAERIQVIKDHMNIIAFMLISAATLALFVGSLGFVSTMSINIIERTREIGIMRAIGASNQKVGQLFILEATLIIGISWLIGYLLSIPLGYVIGDFLGHLIFEVELDFTFSMTGYLISASLASTLILIASGLIRKNLKTFPVYEALAYE